MPEGDTIHRSARTLKKAIGGEKIDHGFAKDRGRHLSLDGLTVVDVEARGKNLLIHFDDGRVLRTHMMMTGSWHIYRPGERWRKSEGAARVVCATPSWVAVCFSAPVVELHRGLPDSVVLQLGPDLLAEPVDLAEIHTRLEQARALPLGVAVMRQNVMSGVGNVYKSEVCWIERINPFLPVASVALAQREKFVISCSRLMRLNLTTAQRTTRDGPGASMSVYARDGRPCFRCNTLILMRRQGEHQRSTYFCPRCQSV